MLHYFNLLLGFLDVCCKRYISILLFITGKERFVEFVMISWHLLILNLLLHIRTTFKYDAESAANIPMSICCYYFGQVQLFI